MTIVEHIATAADLERLPDDGFRYELVRGEVVLGWEVAVAALFA